MVVDADVAGTDIAATNQVSGSMYHIERYFAYETTLIQTFHWLANGATVGDDGALNLTAATTVYVLPLLHDWSHSR
jgi:hypothetical protein